MIDVQRFNVVGNTLLAPGQLQAVLAPFVGQRSLEDLQRAAAAVQRLYGDAGYGGVVAYLPAQTVSGGVAVIQVVEGRVGKISVRGAPGFDEANVRASVPDLRIGQTPRARRINVQNVIANENPAKRLQVLLKPGDQPGSIDADLSVDARPLQSMTVGVDDTGTQRTGRYRIGATWQNANLTGHDDVLSAQYQTSPSKPSQVTILSAGYRLPLYAELATLDAYLAYANVNAGASATAAGDVRINGKGRLGGLRMTWYLPVAGEFDHRVGLALDRREYINNCEVAGLPSGACGPAGANVAVTPLSVDYSVQSTSGLRWGADVALSANLGVGGGDSGQAAFDAVRTGAKRGYSMLRATFSAALPLGERWQLRTRLAGQGTSDALVPGEQFGIGGANSVRGYEERELVGDRGVQGALELVGPELLGPRAGPSGLYASLLPLLFVDAGQVGNVMGAPCSGTHTRCSLWSVGVGLQFSRGPLQARLAVADARRDGLVTRRGDRRTHAALSYSF
ncbi:MAG: ShlB/FhaC/HecB family hemolysin secretion/activation protein [Burkholderiales bacterium]|nr:ShlB/FhaC/HecB family hemolysin secretion/activation protein [Burkholderiales bacterium]